jgi:hypothetical protein
MYVLQTTRGTATVQSAPKGRYRYGDFALDHDQWRWESFEHNKKQLDVESGWGFADTLEEALKQAESYYRPVWAPGPV